MVDARRIVRRHFGRHHPPVHRASARLLTAIAWPPAVLLHLCQIRYHRGSEAVPIKRAFGSLWRLSTPHIARRVLRLRAMATGPQSEHTITISTPVRAPSSKLLIGPVKPNATGDKLVFHDVK